MLSTIPFHASLLGRELKGRKASNAHVLLYGAIEVHAMGEKGCIASNDRLGKETGYSKQTVANRLNEMAAAGWVTVTLKDGVRKQIVPNGNIVFGSGGGLPSRVRGVTHLGNIDKSLDNSPTDSAKTAETAPPKEENNPDSSLVDVAPPIPAAPPTTLKLFYLVIKKYSLTVNNHPQVKKWANDLEVTQGVERAQAYLERLLQRDLVAEKSTQQFVPTLSTAFDLYNKSTKIIEYLKRTKHLTVQAADMRTILKQELALEEEAERIRKA